MAPKKKDKSKSADWLQCSLCGKLILPSDAEIHSKSCDADHIFIHEKTFTGTATQAEDILDGDKNPITKSVRDKDNVVWLSVSVMTMCEIAIGQRVVVNKTVVKKAWPLSGNQLASIGLTSDSLEEMKVKAGDSLTVQKLNCHDQIVDSAVLELLDSNDIFEQEEFCSFVSSYLDGNFLTRGTQLTIKYFGQTCRCRVSDIDFMPPSTKSSNSNGDSSNVLDSFSNNSTSQHLPASVSLPSTTDTSSPCSPMVRSPPTPLATPIKAATESPCLRMVSDSGDGLDLSSSFSTLNIGDSRNNSFAVDSSTPRTRAKCDFPNLTSPTTTTTTSSNNNLDDRESIQGSACADVNQAFGKFVSGVSRLSLEPTGMTKKNGRKDADTGYSLADIGGMADKINELKHRIQRAQHSGSLSRCILVHGPPGTGKTLLVKAVTSSLAVHTVYIAGTDIWSKLFGQAESNLRNIFQSAAERSPSVVVIDDLDVMCPKRSQQTAGQQEHRIVGTLLSLVDGSGATARSGPSSVVVIGVTNNRDNIDPALRRSGRFGCEVEIGVPNPAQRAEILTTMLTKVPHSLSGEDVEAVARNAHGYVGADLTALLHEASVHASTRLTQSPHPDLTLTLEDVRSAGQMVKPSALREIQLEVPQVRWSDIGGMVEVKMRLKEAVELPLTHPWLYQSLGIEPPRGLLMYGPPGCSKTMIARAVATECHLNFLAVKGPELFNQYVGESEKAIREVFRKARAASPSVVFFDEIDAIAGKRGSGSGGGGVDDRVLTQLLTEMDGLEHLKDVFIMAATNRPDKMDRALLRPGRFDSLIHVPLPDDETRREILQTKLKKMKVAGDVSLEALVDATLDYSGAEIIQLCQEAALGALREDMAATHVLQRHFDAAAVKVVPQTDTELLEIYHKFSSAR